MTSIDCLLTTLAALRAHKMRSLLSAAAVSVGVASVIAMLAIGSGAKERVLSQIQSMGTNTFVIWPGWVSHGGVNSGGHAASSLTDLDGAALESFVDGVEATAPIMYGEIRVISGRSNWTTMLTGTDLGYFKIREWDIGNGRLFDPAEMQSGAQVAILGSTLAARIFGEGDPLTHDIRIGRAPFRIIGVMKSRGQSVSGRDQDDTIFVPLRSARQRVLGINRVNPNAINLLYVKISDPTRMYEAEQAIEQLLRDRHRISPDQKSDFGISNLADVYAVYESSARTISFFLAMVASISLIAGGVGIANVMLASINERSFEIGLRVAVGAKRRDIALQFLAESLAIALIGALPGIALGIIAALVLGAIYHWPLILTAQSIGLVVAISAAIGLISGSAPALRAARHDPIRALQA
jgi:putative ABC transport system permease protein